MMENVILRGGPHDGRKERVDTDLQELKVPTGPRPGLGAIVQSDSPAEKMWWPDAVYRRTDDRLADGPVIFEYDPAR